MLKIKVCGITDAANSIDIVAAGIDYQGFIFYEGSRRFIGRNPELLFSNIPSSVIKTGVFVDERPSVVRDLTYRFRLDMIQLHGSESPAECRALHDAGICVIKTFSISTVADYSSLQQYMDVCDYFLFDSGTGNGGGSGRKFDWALIGSYMLDKPFILSGGIGTEDSVTLRNIKAEKIHGVDINSRFEVRPGIKDINKIKAFINDINKP